MGRVVSIGSEELRLQLLRLGLVEGDIVTVTNVAILRGPIALKVNGQKLAIRKSDARRIHIENGL